MFVCFKTFTSNQFSRANYENFNLDYQINIQGEGCREEGRFAKMWLANSRAGLNCKITQFHISLGCWSNDSNWSFYSLHEEISLHLIRCQRTKELSPRSWILLLLFKKKMWTCSPDLCNLPTWLLYRVNKYIYQ